MSQSLPTSPTSPKLELLLERALELMGRIEAVLPKPLGEPDWSASVAFRYRVRSGGHGVLEPVRQLAPLRFSDLKEIDGQKEKLARNTLQFVQGLGANNVLLSGSSVALTAVGTLVLTSLGNTFI